MAEKKTNPVVSNPRQLAPPLPPKNKRVVTPGIKRTDGSAAEWLCWQVSHLELDEWRESGDLHSDLRKLAVTLRDDHNNRIYQTTEQCIASLGAYDRMSVYPLIEASDEVNFARVEDAEKNSEETTSDSSSSS